MPTPRDTCSDCGGATHEIKLLDGVGHNAHGDLEYTLADAKPSTFFHRYPVKGKVVAFMCEACGRIALYGVAKEYKKITD